VILGALAACTGGEATLPTPPAPTPPPTSSLSFDGPPPKNLIMISIDTFRIDQLAAFGGRGDRQFLDGLMDQGVLLTDHMGCSNWTFHATTCTVRGADPTSWGFVPRLLPDRGGIAEAVPPGTDFLAHWLSSAGFHTMLGTTNGLFSENFGNGTGYHEILLAPELGNTPAEVAARETLQLLDASLARGDRFFWHLHLMEPHRTYTPPDEYREGWDALPPIPYDLDFVSEHDQMAYDALTVLSDEEIDVLELHVRTRYDGDVRWLDDQLADIWAELEARGALDDALVVFWSDHGEQHFERGYQAHAFTLYREENDALAFFWAKNLAPDRWEGPTHAIDVAPTVLDVMGVPIPEVVQGVPLGHADPERPRFAFSAAKVGVFQAVRHRDDKLHFSWSDPEDLDDWQRFGQGIHQYDLAADPGELVDRWDPASPRSQELWSLLEPQVQAASALLPNHPVRWPQ
jgi:arylsulfatase A-like enzyme